MKRGGYMYIMTNKGNKVLYTGVTSLLRKRVIQHRKKEFSGSFTARYNVDKLVYYEGFHRIEDAIFREKQIKAGSRIKKIKLIESLNPEYKDLFDELPD
jgi:putative endonuclease